jgi:hypothetical protein
MESNGPRRYKFRNKKEKIWISHTLRKEDGGNTKDRLTMEPSGKQEKRKTKK